MLIRLINWLPGSTDIQQPRRIDNIMASKEKSFQDTFYTFFGTRTPLPSVNHGPDGQRQGAKWDVYVGENDKQYLKTAHVTLPFLLSFMVSSVLFEETTTSVSSIVERKYKAVLAVRDLVDRVIAKRPDITIALPLDNCALPIVHGKMSQAKQALLDICANTGRAVCDWWKDVIAQRVILPVAEPLLQNPVHQATIKYFLFFGTFECLIVTIV